MHEARLMIRNLAMGVALWATAGTVAAITLTPFASTFQTPIGIDWYEPTGQLIMSVNYPSGTPNNLDLVSVGSGAHTNYSTLAGLTNELKVATVRAGSCQGGFAVGDAFTGNGNPGQIVKIPFASPGIAGVPLNPWVTLPLETALVRGSLFQDRFCAAGGDLIVVTGNEQNGTIANDLVGNVWRVTSAGVPTKLATINKHLEGVTTIPSDPLVYGPLSGRIIVGAEDFTTNCGNIPPAPPPSGCGPPNYDPAGGLIIAVNPNAVNDFFTIGGPSTTGIAGHTHYPVSIPVHPEDLDIIRANADFFGVAFSMNEVLMAHSADFAGLCGQILITQEFPSSNTSGLSTLRWNPGSPGNFSVTALAANIPVTQWEHVTFTSGQDCFGLTVVKSPKQGDPGSVFTSGSQVTFTIVVTATGASDDTNVVLTDQLPGNGGLVWSTATSSNGAPCGIVNNLLTCQLGTVAVGTPVTVTVKSTATTPAAACQNQPNPDAHATADHNLTADDSGFLTCTPPPPPPQLRVVKTPKNGTFTQGGQTSFTIVVSNPAPAGSSSATNVTLTDQLPGNGGLVWTNVSINPAQGGCTLTSNFLNCNLGTIAAGASVTVTVTSAATTPAAACQSQPNPDAHATANGGLVADDSGALTCTPANLQGRMTGGGSIFTGPGNQTRVTHGFELHCDANDKRQSLEINWPGTAGSNNFHLTAITKATCIDDPSIQPQPPDAGFDTYIGEGVGTCNGQPATIRFIFTDAGEPGTSDTAEYHISGACTLNTVKTLLTNGNHQAHKN